MWSKNLGKTPISGVIANARPILLDIREHIKEVNELIDSACFTTKTQLKGWEMYHVLPNASFPQQSEYGEQTWADESIRIGERRTFVLSFVGCISYGDTLNREALHRTGFGVTVSMKDETRPFDVIEIKTADGEIPADKLRSVFIYTYAPKD
jgi:hypothetical protein